MKAMIQLILLVQLFVGQSVAETADPRLAKHYINDILQQPEFETTRQVYRWRYMGDSETQQQADEFWPDIQPLIRFIAQMFELLLWLCLGLGMGILLYYIWRWQPGLEHPQSTPSSATPQQRLSPETITLPEDIPEHAWQLWQRGAHQAALSILYRGALVSVTQHHHLAIAPGATEQECLQCIRLNCSDALVDYFALLTHHWQNSAYGQRQPTEAEIQALCQHWSRHFTHATSLLSA